MQVLTTVEEAKAWVEGRVKPDNTVATKVRIAWRWIATARGYEFAVRDEEPNEDGLPHPWHRVRVDFGKLLCNCKSFQYSPYSPKSPKTCKHIAGNDGLDGLAGGLELETRRGDLERGQEIILEASRRDPHRVTARTEHLYSELVRANERARHELAGDHQDAKPPSRSADVRQAEASLGYKLEDYFNS